MTRQPFNVAVVDAPQADAAEIRISGFIGASFWDDSGTSEAKFLAALDAVPAGRKVNLYVNSEGGSIQDGLGMFNAIAKRSQDITAHITGYALSIASVIPLAASKVVSPASAVWMLHKPWTMQDGNADQMRKAAEMLDTHEQVLVDIYAKATGKAPDDIKAALAAETWLTGTEAVAWGLADDVSDAPVSLSALDSSRFRRMPAAMGNHSPPQSVNTNTKGPSMDSATNTAAAAETTPKPAASTNDNLDTPQAAALMRDILNLKAQLAKERDLRISKAVDNHIGEGRLPVALRADAIARATNDESYLDVLAALPKNEPRDPLAVKVENLGNSTWDEYVKKPAGKARAEFRKHRFSDLTKLARTNRGGVMNANTMSADLLPDSLADGVVVALGTKLAPLTAFSRAFSLDAMKPRAVVQVRKFTSGSTSQTNPTNWESGNSVVDAIPVTVNQLTKSFHIANDELNSGHMLDELAAGNANEFALVISKVWTALVLTGTYGAATTVGTAANFDSADIPAILALAKNYRKKNLLLDGSYTARLERLSTTNIDWAAAGAFGFDGIYAQNDWTGATANTVGFVCDPDAIAVAAGMPVNLPAGEFLSINSIPLPDIGLTVQATSWFSRASRAVWASYDVMFGAGAGNASAAELLISA